jgi:predicted DNA-binding transcriptional regulator AlpA
MDDPIYRPKKAMAYLDIGRSALYARVRSGELPAPIKFSPRVSGWRKSVLDAYIKQRETVGMLAEQAAA